MAVISSERHITNAQSLGTGKQRKSISLYNLLQYTFRRSQQATFDAYSFFHLVVCRNQGWLTQYLFLVSRKHRDLKDASNRSTSDNGSIRDSAIELSRYSRTEFFSAAEKNFAFLHSYFSETRGDTPRLCIKGGFLRNGESHVVSVYRDSAVGYNSGYSVSSNSGFLHCLSTGRYFLDNDLPNSALKGKYKNPRLNQRLVDFFASSTLLSKRETLSVNWEEAWEGGGDSQSAYRSTLIIPMTLWNNDLTPDFLEKYGAADAERLIFGFLCMDSPREGFFRTRDVDVGYVIADFLAMYAYAMFNYTDYSETFNDARERVRSILGDVPSFLDSRVHSPFNSSLDNLMDESTRQKESHRNAMIYFTEGMIPRNEG